MTAPRWVETEVTLERSGVNPDVWSPVFPNETIAHITDHAGRLRKVQAWALTEYRDQFAEEPFSRHRWVRDAPDAYPRRMTLHVAVQQALDPAEEQQP